MFFAQKDLLAQKRMARNSIKPSFHDCMMPIQSFISIHPLNSTILIHITYSIMKISSADPNLKIQVLIYTLQ